MWFMLIFVDLLCNIEALYAMRFLYWSVQPFPVFTQPNSTVSKNKTMTMMIVDLSMEGHLEAQLDSLVFTQPNSKNKTMTMMLVDPSMEGRTPWGSAGPCSPGWTPACRGCRRLFRDHGLRSSAPEKMWKELMKLFLPNIQVYMIIWIVSYNVLYVWLVMKKSPDELFSSYLKKLV